MRTYFTASIACLALTLALSGQVQLSEISATPEGPYSASVGFGQSTTLDLAISNSNSTEGADLVAYFSDGISADLDGALSSLNSNIDSLLGIITERYLFRDGITGTNISDGGGDMYDGGNYLRFGTNTSTALTYSDNLVTSTIGVNSTEYFTRKYDGLFVLGADYGTNAGFHITGNLGADGSGSVTLLDFDPGYGYHAYFKVVHSAGDPSINQLILVPKGSALVRTSPTTTSYDTHSVTGLPENRRLYYLLFAKSSGQTFPESDVEDLAEQFLSLVNPGPAWFDFPEVSIGANSSENIQVTLDAQGLASGLYTTDFAISPDHLSADTIPTGQFTQLSLTVESSAFSPEVDTIEVGTIPNYSPDPVEISLQPVAAGLLPNLSAESSEPWAIPEVVTNQNTISVSFNLAILNAGTHTATISITSGRTTQVVEIVVVVNELNLVKLLPDPMRPRLYAINQNEKDQGNLIVYNTLTQIVTDVIPLGNEPSDMDLTENSEELLVINTSDPSIQRIDLDALAVTDTYQLTEFSNRNDDYGAHVSDGPGDIIYYVDEQWGPRLRVFDTSTGTVLQTLSSTSGTSPDTSNNYGYGDIVVSPDRSRLFGWSQYGDGAGNISTGVTGFNITSGGLLSGFSKSETYLRVTNFERDPFDTPAMMTEDGSTLIIKNRVVDQQDLDTFPIIYPDEILSISPQAEIVSGANAIYSGVTAETFFTFPTSNQRVQAILPDYSHLAYVNTSNNQLTWLDLVANIGSENLGLGQQPAEGATVFTPDQLNWLPISGYGSYDVYLGTSPSSVAAAGTTSPEYLGTTTGPRINTPGNLTLGTTYYWRVDGRSANGTQTGAVMSFTVANIDTQVDSISHKIPVGAPINELQIVPFSGTPGTNWSATTTSPWISFQRASGSTQNNLEFRLNTQELLVGEYSGTIQIFLDGSSIVVHEIEIDIEVNELDIVKLLPDPMRPRMYAINQDEKNQGSLIVYNSLTQAITEVIPLGNEPTDMDLTEDSAELLVINTSDPSIQRIDLDSLSVTDTYQLTEFSDRNDDFGAHVADGPGDIIYYVDEQGGPRLRVFDTGTETVLQTLSSTSGTSPDTSNNYGYGDIVVSPDRSRLFGWSQYGDGAGVENTSIIRFDIATNGRLQNFEITDSTYSETNFTRRPFDTPAMMTANGSALIVKDRSVDLENLDQFLEIYPDEILSISPEAEVVSGANAIYSGSSSEVLYTFPTTNQRIQTILPDYSNLVYFTTTGNQLTWLDLEDNVGAENLNLSLQPTDGSIVFSPEQLSWLPIPGYGTYNVYLGTDAGLVASANTTSPEFRGTTGSPYFSLEGGFELGTTYYWRVDGLSVNGTENGSVMTFTVATIDADISSLELHLPEGAPTPNQTVQFTGIAGTNWTAATESPWIEILTPSGTTETDLELRLVTQELAEGNYSGTIQISVDGSIVEFPVELTVLPLDILKLESRPSSPYTYALSATPKLDGPSFLLEIAPASASITRYLECGDDVVDFALNQEANQAFVITDDGDSVVSLNLSEWLNEGAVDISSNSSRAAERILAAPDGNFLIGDSYSLYSVNSETGEGIDFFNTLAYGFTRGKFSEDGSILYLASSSYMAKASYDAGMFSDFVQGDATTSVSGNVRIVGNATADRLFAGTWSYDSKLKINWYYDEIILATDSQGVICLGDSSLYWTESGEVIESFFNSSSVATISGDDQYILRYINTNGTLESVRLANYLRLPGPNIQPGQIIGTSPDQLSVPSETGTALYRFYIGQSPDSLSYLGESVEPVIDLETALPNFGTYYWRVDYINRRTTTSGAVYNFTILPAAIETGINGVKTTVNFQNRELLTGSGGYNNYNAKINPMDPLSGELGETNSYSRAGGYSSSSPFGKDVVKAGNGYYTLDDGGIYSVSTDEKGFIIYNGIHALPDEATPISLAASGDLLYVSTGTGSSYPAYNYKIHIYRTFPELTLEATIEVPESNDGSTMRYFGRHFSAHGDHLAVRGYVSNTTTSPRINSEAIFIYRRDHETSSWGLVDTELVANASPGSYDTLYFNMSSDDGLIVVASNINSSPQVSILREQPDGSFDTEAFIDSTEFPSMRRSYIQVDADQNRIAIALRTADISPADGAIFVLQNEGNTWRVKEPLTRLTGSSFAYDVSLADGWLATMADEQVLLYDIAPENIRPLITSPRPFQLVYERPFEIPLTFDDPDDESVEMHLLPDLDWVSIEDTASGFVLAGTAPADLIGTVTLRITATDASESTDTQTFDIRLLSPEDVPVVESLPASETLGVGQELTFRPEVSGTGPFTWQWYKDGVAIPGATKSKFSIDFLSFGDSGSYTARITNAVGTTQTDEVEIEVRPANRFAGDWPMFGNGPKHLGFHPATLDTTHAFVEAWSKPISSGYINRAVIAENKVFATPYVRFNGPDFAYCFDLDTGEALWSHEFPQASSLNPPAYHDGRIYVQRVKGTDDRTTQLWSLDSQSGETVWSAPHGAQWESYESPTVTDDGIWINGGTYGGMYGFDLDGTQRFFEGLAQYDDWTPTYSNGHLYTWVAGVFTEHNPSTGEDMWYVNTGWNWSGWSMNTVAAVTDSVALLISTTDLICVDLNNRDVRWRVEKRYLGSPAVTREHAYVIYQNRVETFDLNTGEPRLIYETGNSANLYSAQPLLLNDHLIVATSGNTYIFEIGNTTPIQILPTGGRLSYSQGYLLVAGSTGTLTAYFANDVPDFISNPPNITADAAASDESLDISEYVYDADEEDQLKYAIVENTNPSIFSSITLGATDGLLNIQFAPYVFGSSDVTIRVSDPDNTYSEYTIVVSLPPIPELEITEGPIAINRQTGLYEQTLTVKNVGGRAIGGFEIQVSELEGDFQLLGYEGGLIGYYQPVGAGESVALTLQYYSPTSALPPSPEFEQSHSYAPVDPEEALTPGVPVDRVVMMDDGSVLIEFPSIPGRVYAIQYSYDMEIWYQSSYLSLAGANRTQWLDDGMPKTDQHPSKVTSKFYRVLDITE